MKSRCPVALPSFSGVAVAGKILPSMPISPTWVLLGIPPRAMTAQFSNSNGGILRSFASDHGKSRTTNPRPARHSHPYGSPFLELDSYALLEVRLISAVELQ